MPYLLIKAIHVASVLLFVGGLLLQSLALGASRRGDGEALALVSAWDRRVTLPAMLLAWLAGAAVAAEGGWFGSPWLWAKLVLVAGLTGLHGVQSGWLRRLRRGELPQSTASAFRMPAIVAGAAVLIALLAVAKPF